MNNAEQDSRLIKARDFAIAAHGNQKYGEHPYSFHLDAVVKLLEPYGEDAKVIGFLHDTAEDCNITISQLQGQFGDLISECVSLVTDVPGENRKIRKALTNAKLSLISVDGPCRLALIVKAADRLANIGQGGKIEMYRREHDAFRKAVYRPGLCDELWERIEEIIRVSDQGMVMGQLTEWIKKVEAGETVKFRPRGSSMSGKIEDKQLCTIKPIDALFGIDSIKKGDVVLCRVGKSEYLHLVIAIRGKENPEFLIGNNKGKTNGWTRKIYGKCICVES